MRGAFGQFEAAFIQYQSEAGNFFGFAVNPKAEPFRKESLKHFPELIGARPFGGLSNNVKLQITHPGWSGNLIVLDMIRAGNAGAQGGAGVIEPCPGIPGSSGLAWLRRRRGLNRGDLKCEWWWRIGLLPREGKAV